MRLLLIADADSLWVREYCNRILLRKKFKITISSHHNSRFVSFYNLNHIEVVVQEWHVDGGNFFAKMRCFYRELATLKKREFDLVHIQYGSRYNLRLAFFLNKRTIVTFWGSDLLRSTAKNRREIAIYLKKAEKIVVLTEKMRQLMSNDKYLRSFDNRTSIFDFGITNLEYINEAMAGDAQNCPRNRFDIPADKIVIAIGYNKSEAQQHTDVIKALINLPDSIRGSLLLLFHMSYGECSVSYYDELIELLEKMGSEYRIVTDFLVGKDLAYIRLAADYYINAQTTDSLAATINEYLYAGKIVFNPGWINYKELDDLDVGYIKYENFEELPGLLIDHMEGNGLAIDTEKNQRAIWDNYSWDAREKEWIELYD